MSLFKTLLVSRSPLGTHPLLQKRSAWRPLLSSISPSRKAHVGPSTRSWSRLSLFSLGLVLAGSAAYAFHSTASVFPGKIKKSLRDALRAEKRAELENAEISFKAAYEMAKPEVEGMDWLKRSGIGIRWAKMLEDANRKQDAIKVYGTVYHDLREAKELTGPEKMRAIAVAQKLALLSQDDDEVESYLTWSVEEILRLTLPKHTSSSQLDHSAIVMGELDLPDWATGAQLGPCLEALGEFYARKGQPHYALPLYLQAISLLLPVSPGQSQPSLFNLCHAAILMNNIAQLLVHPNVNPPSIIEATSWANRGLGIAKATLAMDSATTETRECIAVQLVALQNLGTLAEMEGNLAKARGWFDQARDLAESLGIISVTEQAQASLDRLAQIGEKK